MKVIIVSIMMLGVVVFSSPVYAEPERYDFLKLDPKEQPIPFVPVFAVVRPDAPDVEMTQQEAHKEDEAKRKAIIALLRQRNRRLDEAKARDIADFIMQACEQYNQEPFIIAALMVNESSARPDVVSRGGDYGLMHVRWRVHQRRIRERYPHITRAQDMLNPKYNVLVGTEIFSTYRKTANDDISGALRYYTGGSTRMAGRVFADVSRPEDLYMNYLQNL